MYPAEKFLRTFFFINSFKAIKQTCIFRFLLCHYLCEADVNRICDQSCKNVCKEKINISNMQFRLYIIVVKIIEHITNLIESLIMTLTSSLSHYISYLWYSIFKLRFMIYLCRSIIKT